MVVQCPKCERRYQADDAKVPAGGCRVRCPSCDEIFTIYPEPLDIELIPVEVEVERAPPEVEVTPEVEVAPPEEVIAPPEEVIAPPEEVIAPPEEVVVVHPEAEVAPEVGAAPPEAVTVPPKPPEVVPELDESHERAKRLARALVKDIVLYHPQEVEAGLREGRLAETVGDEIRKSWNYYRERISEEILDTTNYFKDALNEILCRGKKVFT